MSGINPLNSPMPSNPLRGINKDGGGSGGQSYFGSSRDQEPEKDDEAEISQEAKEKLSHAKVQDPAPARPESQDARLEILAEIQAFNEAQNRKGSQLKAFLKPAEKGQNVLYIEDPSKDFHFPPFGQKDIFHFSPQLVRTKLQSFEQSSGSFFNQTL